MLLQTQRYGIAHLLLRLEFNDSRAREYRIEDRHIGMEVAPCPVSRLAILVRNRWLEARRTREIYRREDEARLKKPGKGNVDLLLD